MVWEGVSLEYCTDLCICGHCSLMAIQHRNEVLYPSVIFYSATVGPYLTLMDDNTYFHKGVIVDGDLGSDWVQEVAGVVAQIYFH